MLKYQSQFIINKLITCWFFIKIYL